MIGKQILINAEADGVWMQPKPYTRSAAARRNGGRKTLCRRSWLKEEFEGGSISCHAVAGGPGWPPGTSKLAASALPGSGPWKWSPVAADASSLSRGFGGRTWGSRSPGSTNRRPRFPAHALRLAWA